MSGSAVACGSLDTNTRAILAAVSERVIGDAKGPVVDVGCGSGSLLRMLSEQSVGPLFGVGWEVSVPEGVTKVDRTDLCAAGWACRLDGRTFDWVVSTEVLEHLVNPFQFLTELRRLVADDGRLLLTFPNVHNWRSIVGYALGGRFSGFFGPNFNDGHPLHDQHIFIPNMHLVHYFLTLTGFEPVEVSYINGGSRLTAQTTMVISAPRDPVPLP